MGIRAGYRVEGPYGMLGTVQDTRSAEEGAEPCFATVRYVDGRVVSELLRDLVSRPPGTDRPPGTT